MGNENQQLLEQKVEQLRRNIENSIRGLEKFSRVKPEYAKAVNDLISSGKNYPDFGNISGDLENVKESLEYEVEENHLHPIEDGFELLAKIDEWKQSGYAQKDVQALQDRIVKFYFASNGYLGIYHSRNEVEKTNRNLGDHLKQGRFNTLQYQSVIGPKISVRLSEMDIHLDSAKLDVLKNNTQYFSLVNDGTLKDLAAAAEKEKQAGLNELEEKQKSLAEKKENLKNDLKEKDYEAEEKYLLRKKQAEANEEKSLTEEFFAAKQNETEEAKERLAEELGVTTLEELSDSDSFGLDEVFKEEEQKYKEELDNIKTELEQIVVDEIIPNVRNDFSDQSQEADDEITNAENVLFNHFGDIEKQKDELEQLKVQAKVERQHIALVGNDVDDLIKDLDTFMNISKSSKGFSVSGEFKNTLDILNRINPIYQDIVKYRNNLGKLVVSKTSEGTKTEITEEELSAKFTELNSVIEDYFKSLGEVDASGKNLETLDEFAKNRDAEMISGEEDLALKEADLKLSQDVLANEQKRLGKRSFDFTRRLSKNSINKASQVAMTSMLARDDAVNKVNDAYLKKIIARDLFFISRKHDLPQFAEKIKQKTYVEKGKSGNYTTIDKRIEFMNSQIKSSESLYQSSLDDLKIAKENKIKLEEKIENTIREKTKELFASTVQKRMEEKKQDLERRIEERREYLRKMRAKANEEAIAIAAGNLKKVDEANKHIDYAPHIDPNYKFDPKTGQEAQPEVNNDLAQDVVPINPSLKKELSENDIQAAQLLNQEVESNKFKNSEDLRDQNLVKDVLLHDDGDHEFDEPVPGSQEEPEPEIREELPRNVNAAPNTLDPKPYLDEIKRLHKALEKTVWTIFQKNTPGFKAFRQALKTLVNDPDMKKAGLTQGEFFTKFAPAEKAIKDYIEQHKDKPLRGYMPQRLKIMSRFNQLHGFCYNRIDPTSVEARRKMLKEKYLHAEAFAELASKDPSRVHVAQVKLIDQGAIYSNYYLDIKKPEYISQKPMYEALDQYINSIQDADLINKLKMHGEDFYSEAQPEIRNIIAGKTNQLNTQPNAAPQEPNHPENQPNVALEEPDQPGNQSMIEAREQLNEWLSKSRSQTIVNENMKENSSQQLYQSELAGIGVNDQPKPEEKHQEKIVAEDDMNKNMDKLV